MWNGNTQLFILILHIDLMTQRKENLGSQKSNMSIVAKGSNVPGIITLIGRHVWGTKGNYFHPTLLPELQMTWADSWEREYYLRWLQP